MMLSSQTGHITFGPFTLIAEERRLERDGVLLRLGGRALDILLVLIKHAGSVVEKRSILAQVWQDVHVDDVSMRVHINALRKALGDGVDGARYIVNVPGRGYSFVAPVQHLNQEARSHAPETPVEVPSSLPKRLGRMVGREENIEEIRQLLQSNQFVSILGPGGIGKTTVAVSVGNEILDIFSQQVYFVDFGSLSDPALLPNLILSVLGVDVYSENLVESLTTFIRDKKLLLVLDSCEHVIECAAEVIERIFAESPEVHILTTSREALQVEGEYVYRLPSLAVPPEDSSMGTTEVMQFSAVQLFAERAGASLCTFTLCDLDAPFVAEICRKLDGNALAIELAASRVDAYGIHELSELLSSNLVLPWRGRRTALGRHQTLRATLDWSYNLLSPTERIVLNRASILIGSFGRDAVTAIALFGGITHGQMLEGLAGLIGKSLITSETSGDVMTYRLPDTTRAYALEKLAQSEETSIVSKRHALHYCHGVGELARINIEERDPAWKRKFSGLIANVRIALEWSISSHGDPTIAINLGAASARVFLELTLFSECHRWMAQVLTVFDESTQGTFRELEIQTALAQSLMFAKGSKNEALAAFKRALEIAEVINDLDYQLRIHANLHWFFERMGDLRTAKNFAKRSYDIALAIDDPAGRAVASAALGISCHLEGSHLDSIQHLEFALATKSASRRISGIYFGFDYHNRSRITLARELWLQGRPDQAIAQAKNAVEQAATLEQPITQCIALIWAISVLIWTRDFALAAEYNGQLARLAQKHSLTPYQPLAQGFAAELSIHTGDPVLSISILQECLVRLHENRYGLMSTAFMAALAEGLLVLERNKEALNVIEETILLAERNGDLYIMPELLRLKGSILTNSAVVNASVVEDIYRDALDLAKQRSALGWTLRAATSLAQFYYDHGQREKGLDVLGPVFYEFIEGFQTADLRDAKELLDRLVAWV